MDDEFGMLDQHAAEAGLAFVPPTVTRTWVEVAPGQRVSAIVWGDGPPELVLVHGQAQNAHTWDTVALALGRPLVAVDLPGHGRSDWRPDRAYQPERNAEALATVVDELAPHAEGVVGMSLGGLTTICLAARQPDLVRRAVIVDITPAAGAAEAAPIIDFINGPESFESFDVLLERTMAFSPDRSEASLRRGLLYNAQQREDGRWVWRYDRLDQVRRGRDGRAGFAHLWDDVDAITCPLLLVVGGSSPIVGEDDVDEWRRRQPSSRVEVVDGAGHSVQGDKPVELAALIEDFVRS